MTIEQVCELIEIASELEIVVQETRERYSGRGMFGEETCALVIEGGAFEAGLIIGFWIKEQGFAFRPKIRTDSMGLGVVIY